VVAIAAAQIATRAITKEKNTLFFFFITPKPRVE